MSRKKDCMFQCVLREPSLFGGYTSQVNIVEDTGLITRAEAEELWHKWFPKVRDQLKDGADVEMGIWVKCKDTTDYHTFEAHIDSSCEVDDYGKVWEVTRKLVKL